MIKNIRLWLSMQNVDADTVLEAIALSAAIINIITHLAGLYTGLSGFYAVANVSLAVLMLAGLLWLSK